MNKVILPLIVVLFLMTGFCLYKTMNTTEVKFVRSADLIYGYQGMKEAQVKQQQTTDVLKGRLDTLQMDFQKTLNRYNEDFPGLSAKEREEREKLLKLQQNNLMNYSKQMENNIKEEDQKLTEGVLNQVNAFVEEYAEEKGYDIILGTTNSGNILYAKDYMDITEEVLKALNENYKKQPVKEQ